MKLFDYLAITAAGERVSGQVEAANRAVVIEQLQKSGSFAVNVREVAPGVGRSAAIATAAHWSSASKKQITGFTRELGMLLTAGLPLASALTLMAADRNAKPILKLVVSLHAALNDGKSLHEAISAHPKLFPPSYRSMVLVGEASGTLPKVLERIADAREQDEKLRGKLVSAMIYPAFLVLTGIGAVVIMLGLVVPRFKTMIVNANVTIPAETQLIITVSDWLNQNWMIALAAVLGLILVAALALRTVVVQRCFDTAFLALPVVGQLMRYAITIRFCRTIGTLLESGVELQRALKMIETMFDGQRMGGVVGQSYDALRKGQDFTAPIGDSGLLPTVAVNMLRIGQETGDLAAATLRLAGLFEGKLEIGMQRLFTVLEPLIIVLVSIFVAGIIMSIVGAVISVNDLVL